MRSEWQVKSTDYSDQRIVVTGAGSGLGRAAALHCLELGARVCLLDFSEEACLETYALTPWKERAQTLICDVSDKVAMFSAVDEAAKWLGGISGLVSAAGVVRHKASADLTVSDLGFVLGVNFYGSVYANQAVYPHMRDAGSGSIINFGSFAGMRPAANNAAYSASKGAIAAWTRSIAAEWGPANIRANTIAPVAITPMSTAQNDTLSGMSQAEFLQMFADQAPLRRIGDPLHDIAPAIAFLLSDAARFVTGQVISVDGGLAMMGA